MPEIARVRKDGSAVESAEQQNKRERTWDLNEGYTAEKQSKKNQRKLHAAKRGTWNGVSPVTRIVQSKRLYDRNRAKQEDRRDED